MKFASNTEHMEFPDKSLIKEMAKHLKKRAEIVWRELVKASQNGHLN